MFVGLSGDISTHRTDDLYDLSPLNELDLSERMHS